MSPWTTSASTHQRSRRPTGNAAHLRRKPSTRWSPFHRFDVVRWFISLPFYSVLTKETLTQCGWHSSSRWTFKGTTVSVRKTSSIECLTFKIPSLQTPPRKPQSLTLNNPEAYPSPQSPPRRTASQSITRPGTPTRTFSMPGTWDEEPTSLNDMTIDFPPRPSPVPTELFSTADNFDQYTTLSNDLDNGQMDPTAMAEVRRWTNPCPSFCPEHIQVQQMLDASRTEVMC